MKKIIAFFGIFFLVITVVAGIYLKKETSETTGEQKISQELPTRVRTVTRFAQPNRWLDKSQRVEIPGGHTMNIKTSPWGRLVKGVIRNESGEVIRKFTLDNIKGINGLEELPPEGKQFLDVSSLEKNEVIVIIHFIPD